DNRNTLVAVTVRQIDFVLVSVDSDFSHLGEVSGAAAVRRIAWLAVLGYKLAIASEYQHVGVAATVSADPDVAVWRNIDTVVGSWPGKAFAWAAPSVNYIAFRVEFDDGRCRGAAIADAELQADFSDTAEHFVLVAVNNEDVITGVDVHTDSTAENPLVGQGFGPERVHFECRSHDSAACSFSSLL